MPNSAIVTIGLSCPEKYDLAAYFYYNFFNFISTDSFKSQDSKASFKSRTHLNIHIRSY